MGVEVIVVAAARGVMAVVVVDLRLPLIKGEEETEERRAGMPADRPPPTGPGTQQVLWMLLPLLLLVDENTRMVIISPKKQDLY